MQTNFSGDFTVNLDALFFTNNLNKGVLLFTTSRVSLTLIP